MKRAMTSTAVAVLVLGASLTGTAAPKPKRPVPATFGAVVQVTPGTSGGYEPGVVADRFGNLFATAHKENHFLALSPDANAPTQTRSMSWTWMSADGGATWKNIPGMTLDAEQHDFGDEGDMALDDAGHLYFVDTNVADVTFTRWTVSGRDQVTFDTHRPLLPAAQAVDDRPWITAHGNGQVFYLGNQGDKVTYPFGGGGSSPIGRVTDDPPDGARGPGRYTVYASHDAGNSFDSVGYTLNDSGWCRPAADHRAGSTYVYVFCGNDAGSWDVSPTDTPQAEGKLWAFGAADDGRTWNRYRAGSYFGPMGYSNVANPSVQVAPDGSIWAMFEEAATYTVTQDRVTGPTYKATSDKLTIYHSVDHGKTWKSQVITPKAGFYHYGWLSVAPDSKTLGLGIFYRANEKQPWKVYGAIWKAGDIPALVSIDDAKPVATASQNPPGDFMSTTFGPDGRLSVIWTRASSTIVATRDIFFARSITAAPAKRA